jgi:hypothetical protein
LIGGHQKKSLDSDSNYSKGFNNPAIKNAVGEGIFLYLSAKRCGLWLQLKSCKKVILTSLV